MSNAASDCGDRWTEEDCAPGRYMQVDPDGAVRVYRYEETLGRYVVDEQETARLDPEFVEEFRNTINERRYLEDTVDRDNSWCVGDRDWGHASGW